MVAHEEGTMARINAGGRVVAAVVVVLALAGWWIAGGVSPGHARGEIPLSRTTAMFGVATGQAARAGIVNVKGEGGITVVGVRFFDAQGQMLAESTGRHDLRLGEAFFFDFSADPRERAEIRAVFALLGKPTDFVASVQIFDVATGRTTAAERFLPEGGRVTHTYFGPETPVGAGR